MEHKHVQTRRRWWALGGAVLLAVAVVGALALTGVLGSSDGTAAPTSTPTSSAPAATTAAPAAEPVVRIDETRTMPYTPVWNPPDAGEAFWQVVDPDEGYPEDGGTDYVLAHACRDGGCVGDRVRALTVGDQLAYRGEQYLVEQKLEIHKTEIGEQDIWYHDPDRLVVITCILDPETGEYDENDIIVATRAT